MNPISRHLSVLCFFCLIPMLVAASSQGKSASSVATPAPAAILPLPKSFPPVSDYADMFSSKTEKKISRMLDTYKRQSGLGVMVMTIGSLRGDDINMYADRVLDASGKHALLIIARREGKIALMLDEDLEGRFSQADARRLISSDIVTHFQAGLYDKGIEAAVKTLITTLGTAPLHKSK